MYYFYYKQLYPDNILVYIEEFNREDGTVLFDFLDSNEYNLFMSRINIQSQLDKPTMVLLNNYNKRRIQENTIYSIKAEIVEIWKDQIITTSDTIDSFLIGNIIDVKGMEEEIFSTSVSLNDFYNYQMNHFMKGYGNLSKLPFTNKGKLSVTIRNIGQGNWNEINVNDNVKIVYDAGAPVNSSKTEVLQIIGDRNLVYSKSKPVFILSHWDKDHYHALLGMSNAELQNNFSSFVCRDRVPNLTSRILFKRFSEAVGLVNTISIAEELNHNKKRKPIYFKNITPPDEQIVLYNAQYHKNRNISGLLLTVKSAKKSVILPADADYEQISRDILPHLNFVHRHTLVVPHHGGKAGVYIYNKPSLMTFENAIISVGKNRYKHPIKSYLAALKADKFSIQQTNMIKNDIIVSL